VIDLHLHTTASDGRCTPSELVERCLAAGLRVIAVTDHDTIAAGEEVERAATDRGIHAVSGIEITAIDGGVDQHILGYFLDRTNSGLSRFLARQRLTRIARVEAIAERLASLGVPVDVAALVEEARTRSGRSIGRPQVARAMVRAGHVPDVQTAFDLWLGQGLPGFVPRSGASPEEVVSIIHEAGGLASMAHPGRSISEGRLGALCEAGLDAVEAFHPDHDAARVQHYVQFARVRGLLLTGGSDFHGEPTHGRTPGSVTLPRVEWERLFEARARHVDR